VSRLILYIAATLIAASFGSAQQPGTAAPAGNAENGKKLFVKEMCYSCHGFDGHGGGAGVKLAPKPIAINGFIGIVRHPPKSSMPTFGPKVISDSDLRDIWAYLNTVPPTPLPKDLPLLSLQ
jgi:mono/diheme cytochrome c family protein